MKKIFLIFNFIFLSCFLFGFSKKYPNVVKKTDLIRHYYLLYDVNSYGYNKETKTYTIDIAEEINPGGDSIPIDCPYGRGNITHLLYATQYSLMENSLNFQYKGFVCAIPEIEYRNDKPISMQHKFVGVYYSKEKFVFPTQSVYLEELRKEINNPTEYNYFGFIKNLKI